MENFFDTLKEWIEVITDRIVAKGTYAKQVVTLKAEVRKQEKALNNAYLELGRMYYEQHSADGGEIGFEPNIKAALNARRNIGKLTIQIEQLQANQIESK